MLKHAFRHRTVDKTYHALVQGHPDPLAGHRRRADRPAPQARLQVRGHGRRQAERHPLRDARGAPVRQPARGPPRDRPHPPDPGAHGRAEAPVRRRPHLRRRPDAGRAARADPAVAARRPARLRAPRQRASTSSTSRPTPTTSSTPWTPSAMPSEAGPEPDRGASGDRRRRRRAGDAVPRRAPAAAYPAIPPPVHPPEDVRRWLADPARRRRTPRSGSPSGRRRGPSGCCCSRTTGCTRCTSHPARTGARDRQRCCSTWPRACGPTGLGLWVFEANAGAPGGSTRRHGFVERAAHRRHRERGAAPRTSRWPGPTRRRWRACAAGSTTLDDRLAALLAERAETTALVQQLKEVPGHAGRDPAREDEIVGGWRGSAPALGEDRLRRIMQEVITESLDAASTAPPTPEGDR